MSYVERPCRLCSAMLSETVLDLGLMPNANAYVKPGSPEIRKPLQARRCLNCSLIQVNDAFTPEELFSDYAYFSSYSDSWLAHAQAFVNEVIPRFGIDRTNQVIEIASNDGYLLQYVIARGIPALGIEPARNIADAAHAVGVPTYHGFFGKTTAKDLLSQGYQADLLIANNVVAHVPDLNDFIAGLALLLAPQGILSIEIQYVRSLLEEMQFDTIYHEHFCYFSLSSLSYALSLHGLEIFDLTKLSSHGGSLRVYAAHRGQQPITSCVASCLAEESVLSYPDIYMRFREGFERIRRDLRAFLMNQREQEHLVVGYGAPAKASTLLNACSIDRNLIPFSVDRNPHKQGFDLPGCGIPIRSVEALFDARPDIVLIFPWNLKNELRDHLADIDHWGGRLAIPIPQLEIID